MSEKETKYVRWTIFIWAIGILLTLFVAATSMAGNALSRTGSTEGDVKSIQTDIAWIKSSLQRIETSLK